MEKTKLLPQYQRFSDYTVKVTTLRGDVKNRVINGKVLFLAEETEVVITENPPRPQRSVEVGRSEKCRMVRRPDGDYTLTIHFNANEKLLKERLISQVRNMYNIAQFDAKEVKG